MSSRRYSMTPLIPLKEIVKRIDLLITRGYIREWKRRISLAGRICSLKKDCSSYPDLNQAIDALKRSNAITLLQKKSETLNFLNATGNLNPKNICEIGGAQGGTLFLFCRIASPAARILSVDINYASHQAWAFQKFFGSGRQVRCLSGDSHSEVTRSNVREFFQGEKLDVLFIDGDHSLAGVSKDYAMYGSLVRKGGIIGFHDIVPDYRTRFGKVTDSYVGEVPQFWKMLKSAHPNKTYEIIEDPDQDGFGIGVLEV